MTKKSTSLRVARILKLLHEQRDFTSRNRYVFTKGKFVICSRCVSFNTRRFALDDLWEVSTDSVNRSDNYLFCHNCGDRINPLETSKKVEAEGSRRKGSFLAA